MNVFDIETGPLSESEVCRFWKEPKIPTPDEIRARYKTANDPKKGEAFIAEKLSEAAEEYRDSKFAFFERAALSPTTGKVLAIGYQLEDGKPSFFSGDEADVISSFWALLNSTKHKSIIWGGWNCHEFDIPFLVRRSWVLGLKIPSGAFYCSRVGPNVVDLMKTWSVGVWGHRESLDNVAKLMGVGSKPATVTGATFAAHWNGTPSERAEATNYLLNDIKITAEIAARIY